MNIVLSAGRRIEMQSLEQHFTYAGVLCGRFSAADHDRQEEMCSSAAFLWIQEEFGLPDGKVVEAIQAVEWAKVAKDWSW